MNAINSKDRDLSLPVTPAKKIAAVAAFMCKLAMRFCAALIPLLPVRAQTT
jgi:hypothetical protein